jgi:hypothetical protein
MPIISGVGIVSADLNPIPFLIIFKDPEVNPPEHATI